jgi:WD40 repeat protein
MIWASIMPEKHNCGETIMIIYNRDRISWDQFLDDSSKKNDIHKKEYRNIETQAQFKDSTIVSNTYTVKRMSHDSSVYHPFAGRNKKNELPEDKQQQKDSLKAFTSMAALKRYILSIDSSHQIDRIDDLFGLIKIAFSLGQDRILKCDRIDQMDAYYHWKMGLRVHSNALKNLTDDDLMAKLNIPEFQQERRYYINQACKHFVNDLYNEALDNLLLAQNYEKYDPFVLYTMGLIHLYVPDHLNIDLALKLFLKSAKYYQTEKKQGDESVSYFYAGMCAYILKKDHDAINYTEKALTVSEFFEASFALARFKASIGDESCLPVVKKLVEKNPLYGLKVLIDDAFLNIINKIYQLFVAMRNTAKAECDTIHLAMIADRHLEKYKKRQPDVFSRWKTLFNEANQIYQKNSCMDYLDALPVLKEADTYYQALKQGQAPKKMQSSPFHQYEKQQNRAFPSEKLHSKKDTEIAEKEIFDLLNETKALVHHNTDFQYLTRVTQAQASEKIAYLLDNPIACIDMATLSEHDSSVLTIAFSPCSKKLASGAEDGSIRLWNLDNFHCTHILSHHQKAVNCLQFSPNGKILASASWDKTIKLWDLETFHEIATLTAHTDSVEVLDISMDNLLLASGSNDQTLRLWDIRKKQSLHTFDNFSDTIRSLCFSPDGLQLAAGSWDIIYLWDVLSKKSIRTFKGQTKNYISALAISPDGLSLAAGSHDKTIRLWDMTSKKQSLKLQGHLRRVNCVAFSPDNLTLASGSHDKQVKLWNTKTGQEINGLNVHNDFVSAVSFSPDGNILASASHDTKIRLWQIHYKIMPKDALIETIERNISDARHRRQAQWRADMRCEICGDRLGFIDIFKGRVRCHKHDQE